MNSNVVITISVSGESLPASETLDDKTFIVELKDQLKIILSNVYAAERECAAFKLLPCSPDPARIMDELDRAGHSCRNTLQWIDQATPR